MLAVSQRLIGSSVSKGLKDAQDPGSICVPATVVMIVDRLSIESRCLLLSVAAMSCLSAACRSGNGNKAPKKGRRCLPAMMAFRKQEAKVSGKLLAVGL
jgi:hypothetical protein